MNRRSPNSGKTDSQTGSGVDGHQRIEDVAMRLEIDEYRRIKISHLLEEIAAFGNPIMFAAYKSGEMACIPVLRATSVQPSGTTTIKSLDGKITGNSPIIRSKTLFVWMPAGKVTTMRLDPRIDPGNS